MQIALGILIGALFGITVGWLSARIRLNDERSVALTRLAKIEAERDAIGAQLAAMTSDRKRLADEFEALSARVLEQSTNALLARAEERFQRSQQVAESELAKREQAVRALVEPMQRTLTEVKNEVSTAEKSRIEAHATLRQQLDAMRQASEVLKDETNQLVTALRAPQVRGRWGELQLRRVVEAAGMLPHVDFDEQTSIATDEGALRPDMVVHLPGDKSVVVDAKVAFQGYLQALEAKEENERQNRLDAHAKQLRTHIDQLGAKAYWQQFSATPEFVVMFLPAEPFLQAALERDPTLLEHSFEKNVVIATPATLVALLRTVAYTWRQENLAANAQQIYTAGAELHRRLGTLGKHLTDMSRKLNATVESFNKFNKSLDSNLVTQARRFADLQGIEPPIETPPPLEVLASPAQKTDLYTQPENTSLNK